MHNILIIVHFQLKIFQSLVSKQKDCAKSAPKDKENLEVMNAEPLVAKVNYPTNAVATEIKSIKSISCRLFCKEKGVRVSDETNSSTGKDLCYNKESDEKVIDLVCNKSGSKTKGLPAPDISKLPLSYNEPSVRNAENVSIFLKDVVKKKCIMFDNLIALKHEIVIASKSH